MVSEMRKPKKNGPSLGFGHHKYCYEDSESNICNKNNDHSDYHKELQSVQQYEENDSWKKILTMHKQRS
jgi:hypothetical protein